MRVNQPAACLSCLQNSPAWAAADPASVAAILLIATKHFLEQVRSLVMAYSLPVTLFLVLLGPSIYHGRVYVYEEQFMFRKFDTVLKYFLSKFLTVKVRETKEPLPRLGSG